MSDLTRILEAIDTNNAQAAAELLPLVYGELRRLAHQRMSSESPDHTLNPTALVHEAYIRLVGKDDPRWQNRGHFFSAAAEAMRRILIDHARAKQTKKRGGDRARIALDAAGPLSNTSPDEMLLLNETMRDLSDRYPLAGKLVELRFFWRSVDGGGRGGRGSFHRDGNPALGLCAGLDSRGDRSIASETRFPTERRALSVHRGQIRIQR